MVEVTPLKLTLERRSGSFWHRALTRNEVITVLNTFPRKEKKHVPLWVVTNWI